MLIVDNTNGGKLTRLMRQMRRFNPVPNMAQHGSGSRQIRLSALVEDPSMRDSANSYFMQLVDVVSYFGRQYYEPNKYLRRKGGRTYYLMLQSVINSNVLFNGVHPYIVEM
jgi:hypothetical protein